MMSSSTLGWVDFSSEHRDLVKAVLDLFATAGVVDELGIGIIRDAFADRLFPGISTIQTRAKYFIIVPRILRDYEQLPDRQRCNWPLADYLAENETQCRIRLVERYGQKESLGIIGVSFGRRTDQEVQRQPSLVYWNGLRAFGLVKTALSLAEFCYKHSGHRPPLRMLLEETREERGDDIDADESVLSPIAPLPEDENWPDRLTVTLSMPEGEFLYQQIVAKQPYSLLGQILRDDRALDEFLALRENPTFDDLAELPFIARLADSLLRQSVRLAKLFWQILLGAHIRYNCLLQDRFGEAGRKAEFLREWVEWRDRMRSFQWADWDTTSMWELIVARGSDVKPWTYRFIEDWIKLSRLQPAGTADFDELVVKQERANKRGRARLRPDNRDEQVEDWIGIRALEYRLPQARRIVDDIHRARTGKADPSVGF
jgi:Family of unknown function (DUF6361)